MARPALREALWLLCGEWVAGQERRVPGNRERERENRAVEFGKRGGFETFLREKGGKIG